MLGFGFTGPYFSKESIIIDDYGNDAEVTLMNQLQVAELVRLSGGVFNATNNGDVPDSTFWNVSNANGGAATITNSEVKIALTTTSGSSSQLTTVSLARYIGSNMNLYRSTIRLDAGAANNVRRWGASTGVNPTDGFFFQLSNTTFSIVSILAGSPTTVNSGNFNGKVTSYILDTLYHTYEIYYSNRKTIFTIDGIIIHSIIATTSVTTATKHFRPYISNINTGVGSAVNIYSAAMTISRYGKSTSQPKQIFQQGLTTGLLLKIGPGALHHLNISGITNNAVVNLYDGISISGTLMYSTGAMFVTNQSNNFPIMLQFDGNGGMQFIAGLFLSITGAACNACVAFE